mgnify:CR=1 FL=1
MISRAYGLIAAVAVLGALAVAASLWIDAERRAAVEAERRARIADAIELIRDADKRLGVKRKATNADLCRGMGGQPGECQ